MLQVTPAPRVAASPHSPIRCVELRSKKDYRVGISARKEALGVSRMVDKSSTFVYSLKSHENCPLQHVCIRIGSFLAVRIADREDNDMGSNQSY